MSRAYDRLTLFLIAVFSTLLLAAGALAADFNQDEPFTPEPQLTLVRQRGVRRPNVSPPPSGQCVSFGAVPVGHTAGYQSTTSSGSATFTVKYISDSPTQSVTQQTVQTQSITATADTTLDYETVTVSSTEVRALSHLHVVATSPTGGFTTKVTTDTDFVPSLVIGPVGEWCAGASWTVSPVNATTTVKTEITGFPPTTSGPTLATTVGFTGMILAVNESVTVPAGTFNTVKYEGYTITGNGAEKARTWLNVDNTIVVKQETLDDNGQVTSTTVLTSYN